jgi:hypothetical protein
MLMLSLWLLLLMMMVGHFLLLDELEFEFGVVFFDVWTDAGRLQRRFLFWNNRHHRLTNTLVAL